MQLLYIVFLFLALILESTIIKAPLVLALIVAISSLEKVEAVFFVAFLAGLMLDIISFSSPGLRSLFFVSLVFMIYFYERKFEINNLFFVLFASIVGSSIYTAIFYPSPFFVVQILVGVSFSLLVFRLLSGKVRRRLSYE